MNTEQNMTVGDITPENYGWIISVNDPDLFGGYREIYLTQHRTWEYQGKQKVGLVSKENTHVFGTEYHYDADTSCRKVRVFRKQKGRGK